MSLQFKNKFNNKNKLINQNKNIIEVTFQKSNYQWILYLIIKNNYSYKPTSCLLLQISSVKQFCIENKIISLELSKICSGLDNKIGILFQQ